MGGNGTMSAEELIVEVLEAPALTSIGAIEKRIQGRYYYYLSRSTAGIENRFRYFM